MEKSKAEVAVFMSEFQALLAKHGLNLSKGYIYGGAKPVDMSNATIDVDYVYTQADVDRCWSFTNDDLKKIE